jgi:hypothetical protein
MLGLRRWLAAALVSISVAATASAHAQVAPAAAEDYINPDRPGIADGSNVVVAGRIQIETAVQAELRRPDGGRETTVLLPTLFRLGLNPDWELRIESNAYAWDRLNEPAGGTSKSGGAEPVSVGVKYHFLDGAGVRQPSLGIILRVFPPSGSGDFKTDHVTADLRLAADWDIAPKWSLNPNVGVASYEDSSGKTFQAALFATTLNFNPSPVLNLFIDTGVQSPESKHGHTSVIYDAGGAYIIGHDIQLDVSLGTGAAGATPAHPFVAAGISKRF